MIKEIKFRSIKENLQSVFRFLDKCVNPTDMGQLEYMKLKMACEKVFLNITKYSYADVGDIKITFNIDSSNRIVIRFCDSGVKFNPKDVIKKDFDFKKESEYVGINLLSKLVDSIGYSFENGQNNLELIKKINSRKSLVIKCKDQNDVSYLELEGRIDTNTSPELDKKISEIFKNGKRSIYFDLDKVDYVSSTGLRSFLTAQKIASSLKGEISINNVSGVVYSIFNITGFPSVMKIQKK